MMEVKEIRLCEANAFVIQYHRHHDRVVGHKWSLGAYKNGKLCGVVIVGRPVSRYLDDGNTVEVTRLCTDGTRNACSFLYSSAAKKAKKDGYKKIITYILESETGTSLKAAGWNLEAKRVGGVQWTGKRYKTKIEQMSLFPAKQPPREYKQRWSKNLYG